MGFFLGERGYFFVEGPGGKEGHKANQRGFDGVAYNPKSRHLIIYDNKSYKDAALVDEATAITRNVAYNVDKLIRRVEPMAYMPNQSDILHLLRKTRAALDRGWGWPTNVDIAVSNAGGQATGVSSKLTASGNAFHIPRIQFIDYYKSAKPVKRILSNQDIAAVLGFALETFFQWLGDIGIQREVDRQLRNELAPQIKNILSGGLGVLIVIDLQEWVQPDDNGMRGRLLKAVYVQGGQTFQSAKANWENTARIGPGLPRGWHYDTQYSWIPPLN
jgi:hypothetical protein